MCNKRIEAYIILGTYFIMGLIVGLIIGKESVEKDFLNIKNTQISSGDESSRKN